MFRIKNSRNSTVAKQNCLQSTYDHKMPISKLVVPSSNVCKKIPKPINQQPAIRCNQQKGYTIKTKKQFIKNSQNSNKSNDRKQIGGAIKPCPQIKKIEPTINNKKKQQQKSVLQNGQYQQGQLQRQEKRQKINIQSPEIILETKEQKQMATKIQSNANVSIRQNKITSENQKILEKTQKEQRPNNFLQQKNLQQKQYFQKQQQEKERQYKQMMDKIMMRRKLREEERQKRLKIEQNQNNHNMPSIGVIVNLTDRLAHIQMNENIMDTQINMLLHMKFANYPNKQAIERQVDELERINTSYIMVRSDPTNPLIRGLSNFRIQLFNRVGELLMESQSQLSPNFQGLQIINADSRNYPSIPGIKINRGLQIGVVKQLLVQKLNRRIEECPICLNDIQIGQTAYSVKCGHLFHKSCLQSWLSTNASCPSCRYNIKFDHY